MLVGKSCTRLWHCRYDLSVGYYLAEINAIPHTGTGHHTMHNGKVVCSVGPNLISSSVCAAVKAITTSLTTITKDIPNVSRGDEGAEPVHKIFNASRMIWFLINSQTDWSDLSFSRIVARATF